VKRLVTLLSVGLIVRGAAPVSAQEAAIQGRVLDSGRPLQGVLVRLADSTGEVLGSRLTSPSGGFSFTELQAGEYSVTADMIGYATLVRDGLRLERDEFRSIQLELVVSPIRLDGLDISGERRCGLEPGEGETLARLWTEIRKALQRASFTGGVPFVYEVEEFERRRTRDLATILSEEREEDLIVSGVPFMSIDPEILRERGYVFRNEETGEMDYFGPDADVLLSKAFSETHCFSLQSGEESTEGLVGLHFEPLESRQMPEIEGVLWLDPSTLRLTHIDYRFRNLMRGRGERHLGGRVNYTELPNGLWIIREWSLRIPVVSSRALMEWGRNRSRFRSNDMQAIHEVGGVVTLVRGPEGEPILDADAGLVRGVVEDPETTRTANFASPTSPRATIRSSWKTSSGGRSTGSRSTPPRGFRPSFASSSAADVRRTPPPPGSCDQPPCGSGQSSVRRVSDRCVAFQPSVSRRNSMELIPQWLISPLA